MAKEKKQSEDWKQDVNNVIDHEGFDYAFCDKTDFAEVEDLKFHELRKKYVEAAKELKTYIGYYDY